jgi:hypothetical protein
MPPTLRRRLIAEADHYVTVVGSHLGSIASNHIQLLRHGAYLFERSYDFLRRSAFAFTSSSNCALLPMRIHDSRSFKNIAFSLPSDVLCACASHAAAFSQAFVARLSCHDPESRRFIHPPRNAQNAWKFRARDCTRKTSSLFVSVAKLRREPPAPIGVCGTGQESPMHTCAFCKNILKPNSEWKGTGGAFYCNDFCADSADTLPSRIALLSEKPQSAGAVQ